MSKIHYFARYSQKENFVTNNVLLLLSRIYQKNPILLDGVLKTLFVEHHMKPEVGISFEQQLSEGNANRRPDGSISQSGFRLLVETKLHGNFDTDQLLGHCAQFKNHEQKYLLLIDKETINSDEFKHLFREAGIGDVYIAGVTFEVLVDMIKDVKQNLAPYDYELDEIIFDFIDFCINSKILSVEKYILRLRTSGDTFDINCRFNTYYELRERHNRPYSYFGLYRKQSIDAIGKVRNIIEADFVNGKLVIIDSLKKVDDLQKQNIVGIMKASMKDVKDDWSPYHNHRFIVVENFYPTKYRMKITSPHSALRMDKYIDLRTVLSTEKMPLIEDIAEELKTKEW